ncbi:TetR/AcrR family transcriptional regulator [Caulobacter sp. BK020]|uniref:TetR/AcrR family transcriptional regulator n=1 Tax=Caulobacter sp. BK020 TaxID=2512117 RepID=UPI0010465FC3|nr:TetR/AcrR family transcriptional regulator [Caulobacter sp. BK020]TCS15277.1 TetR family transcriptional regulator [Caulobacter sp. BK020]
MAANAYAISARSSGPILKQRGRPSAAGVETKNAAIRDAALELFALKGFGGTSIVEIAKRAGVTRRTLYARYPDKAALLIDAVRGVIDQRLQIYDLETATSAEAALLEIAADITVRSPSAPLLMRILIAEGVNFSHEGEPLGRAGRDHLLSQLELVFLALMRRNLLPPADALEAATLFTDMVIASGMLSLLTFSPNGSARDILAPRVAFFCAGFGAWANRADPSAARRDK